MNPLIQKEIELRKKTATEMVGKRIEVSVNQKALSINEKEHTAIFIMSTSNIDRHGDVIDQDSWITKYFEELSMFFLQHRSNEFPIGKWLRIWFEADPDNPEEKMMVGEAKFSVDIDDDAKRAWDHVVAGNMGAVSVGFIPHRVEYDEEKDLFVLFDCELMECSLVGIGSNRQATIKEAEETKEESSVDKVIKSKEAIEEALKKADTNKKVLSHLKARENLNKAIRNLTT